MRHAMSMIELVIAIVVMGIVVASLPTILLQTEKNNSMSMRQEMLMAAKTKIGDILTYAWDESSTQNIGGIFYTSILDTNGDNELNRVDANSTNRPGNFIGSNRRKLFSTVTNANPIGPDAGDRDDIDDFNGETVNIVRDAGATVDYVYRFALTTNISYNTDNANYTTNTLAPANIFGTTNAAGISNIKRITVTVNAVNQPPIILRAYSSNIGTTRLQKRPF